MPKRIHLRTLTAEEKAEIRRLAASRKESVRLVQRASIIAAMMEDPDLTAGEAGLRVGCRSVAMGPMWVQRFNQEGLAGLEDQPRSGRKRTHSQAVRSVVISLALQKPRSLGYIPLSCGPWNGCSVLSKSARASTCQTQPSGPGWRKKGSNGSDSRTGSMKPSNTIPSSWKKGEHNPDLCGVTRADTGDLLG